MMPDDVARVALYDVVDPVDTPVIQGAVDPAIPVLMLRCAMALQRPQALMLG